MNPLTALLRSPGVADIDVLRHLPGNLRAVTVLAVDRAAGEALATQMTEVRASTSREPAGDPGEWADYYDWDGRIDGVRVLVTWSERVTPAEEEAA